MAKVRPHYSRRSHALTRGDRVHRPGCRLGWDGSHTARPPAAGPDPGQGRGQGAPLSGSKRTTTDFDVGVLLTSAVESSGTSTLVSGKYDAAHPRAVG